MSRDREAWFPPKPTINVDADDWVWKRWMQGAYRYMRGSTKRGIAAAGTASPLLVPTGTYAAENYLYEVDTTALSDIYLPKAADWPDKEYCFINGNGATSGSQLRVNVYPGSGDTIDNGRITTFIRVRGYQDKFYCKSDGISDWRVIGWECNRDRVHYSLNADTPIAAGLQKVPFNAKNNDPLVIGSVPPAAHLITIRREGFYQVNLHLTWYQTTGGAIASACNGHIYVNGAPVYSQFHNTLLVNPNLSMIAISYSVIANFNATNTIEFYIEPNVAGTIGGGTAPQESWGEVIRLEPSA